MIDIITTILFTVSTVCVINYLLVIIGYICNTSLHLPLPIIPKATFMHTNVFTPALMYQVYFWSNYFSII